LIKNADEGYAISFHSVTEFSPTDSERIKIGGFKKVNDCLYKWWHKDKWKSIDSMLRVASRLIQIDLYGLKILTGGDLSLLGDDYWEKYNLSGAPMEMDRIQKERMWQKDEAFGTQHRVELNVYKDTKKKNHAIEIYSAIEKMCLAEGVESFAPEFTTGTLKNIADAVYSVDGRIAAIEIKSKADNFKRLEAQMRDYKTYSDKVWLVIDKKLTKKLEKYSKEHESVLEGVGILVYDDGVLTIVKEAEVNTPTINYIKLLWAVEKQQMLYGLGLPHSTNTKDGNRDARLAAACLNSEQRLNALCKDVLIARIKNFHIGKHPSNPGMTVEKCAGILPLSVLHRHVYGAAFAESLSKDSESESLACNTTY
jgi:hypothetical protein